MGPHFASGPVCFRAELIVESELSTAELLGGAATGWGDGGGREEITVCAGDVAASVTGRHVQRRAFIEVKSVSFGPARRCQMHRSPLALVLITLLSLARV